MPDPPDGNNYFGFVYDNDVEHFAENFDFEDDPIALEYFNTGFLTSSDPESDWYDPNVNPDDRHDAREAFEEWIRENYEDFDWEVFWEEWADMYEATPT